MPCRTFDRWPKVATEAKLFDPYEIFSNDSTFDEEANGIICRSSTETDDLADCFGQMQLQNRSFSIRSKFPSGQVSCKKSLEDIEIAFSGFPSQPILKTLNWADSEKNFR